MMSGEKKGNWKHQTTLASMTSVLVWELCWELWWAGMWAALMADPMADRMADRMASMMVDRMAVMLVGKLVDLWANLKVVMMDATLAAVRAVMTARWLVELLVDLKDVSWVGESEVW